MANTMYPTEQQIEVGGTVIKFPGLGEDKKFTNGDFNNPEKPASFIPAETINLILDNMTELIKKCGKIPDNSDVKQLSELITYQAIAKTMIQRDLNGNAKISFPIADDDIATRQSIIDIAYPIGVMYQQYPTKSGEFLAEQEPGNLFKNTVWDLVDYTDADGNGVFFRTAGGLASEGRNAGLQKYAVENWYGYAGRVFVAGNLSNGVVNFSNRTNYNHGTSTAIETADANISPSYSSVKTSTETRPSNYQLKIYIRIM